MTILLGSYVLARKWSLWQCGLGSRLSTGAVGHVWGSFSVPSRASTSLMCSTTLEFSLNKNKLYLYYMGGWHSFLIILIFNYFLIPQNEEQFKFPKDWIYIWVSLHRGLFGGSNHGDLVIGSTACFAASFQLMHGRGHLHSTLLEKMNVISETLAETAREAVTS